MNGYLLVILKNSLTEFTGSTMDSREIAKLTGRKHESVLKTIRKTLTELERSTPDGRHPYESSFMGSNGETYPCFKLPKRECLILAAGFNIKLRAAIIDRWSDLESGKAIPLGVNPIASVDNELDIEIERRLRRINMIVGEVPNGVKIATALECQKVVAQRTGIELPLPEYIMQYSVDTKQVTFDVKLDSAFKRLIGIFQWVFFMIRIDIIILQT